MNPNETFTPQQPINSEEQRARRAKQLILVAAAAIAILIVWTIVVQILHALNRGTLIITTNDSHNTITVTKSIVAANKGADADESTGKRTPQTLQSGQKAGLDPGVYLVTVKGSGDTAATRTVTIKSRQTSAYTMNLATSTALEPVANVNALTFAADSSRLYYIDRRTKGFYQIDAQNHLSQLDSDIQFSDAHWVDTSFGVGEDVNNNFYALSNGTASLLRNLPEGSGSSTIITVAPNHDIYLANGKNIYKGTAAGDFKQIYVAANAPVLMSASSTGLLALVYNPGDGSKTNTVSSITILRDNQKVAEKSVEAYDAQWSPDGNYLFTTTDSNSQIFDSNMNQVAVVSNNNVNNPVWLDKNTVLYSTNNQLWKYSISSASAQVIAAAPSGQGITSISFNSDKSYIYLSVQNEPGSNNDLMIERYGLNGQAVPSFLTTLEENLPTLQEGRCLLFLTNFTSPTIQSFGGQPEDNCPAAAANFVQQLGVDSDKLTYTTTNVPPDEPAN